MNTSNIINVPNIEGFKITQYLGVIYSGPFKGVDGYSILLNDVVSQANGVGADWVVSFHVQTSGGFLRAEREFSGFGTAVKVEPR